MHLGEIQGRDQTLTGRLWEQETVPEQGKSLGKCGVIYRALYCDHQEEGDHISHSFLKPQLGQHWPKSAFKKRFMK